MGIGGEYVLPIIRLQFKIIFHEHIYNSYFCEQLCGNNIKHGIRMLLLDLPTFVLLFRRAKNISSILIFFLNL